MRKPIIVSACAAVLSLLGIACGPVSSENSKTDGILDWFKPAPICAEAALLKDGETPKTWRKIIRDQPAYEYDSGPLNYGVEITEEIKKGNWWEAGDSGIVRRSTCSRAYRLDGPTKVYLEKSPVPGTTQILAVRPEQDYLLMTGFAGNTKSQKLDVVQLKLSTGVRKILVTENTPKVGCTPSFDAKPSVSGQYFLIQRLYSKDCSEPEVARFDVTVTVYDANAQKLGEPIQENMTGGSQFSWLSETSFELKDNERSVTYTVPGL